MMKSKRTFKLWEYSVSHNQMLLRSPKNEDHLTNLDIVFVGVTYCDVETLIRGIVLRDGTMEELEAISIRTGEEVDASDLFVLESPNNINFIVAAAVKVLENTMDIFDSPLERF